MAGIVPGVRGEHVPKHADWDTPTGPEAVTIPPPQMVVQTVLEHLLTPKNATLILVRLMAGLVPGVRGDNVPHHALAENVYVTDSATTPPPHMVVQIVIV